MTINQVKDYLSTLSLDLSMAESKQEQLEYLIELGNQVEIDSNLLTHPELRVSGCASNTFINASLSDKIKLSCYSDSYVVKGYLAIFKSCLDKAETKDLKEILEFIAQFAQDNQLNVSHIPSRADAFNRIYETTKSQLI